MNTKLNPWSLLWISLTSMIGSGWLFGSLYSAHFAGPAAILAWPIAAFLLLFVALSYAEVATMFPQPNALAQLPFYTHGRLTSLIMGGLAWISLATIPVIETQGLIQYASNYLPCLVSPSGLHYTTTIQGYALALTLLLSFVILNYFGMRVFNRINGIFTFWKLVIPTLTIFLLLMVSWNGNNFTQYGGFMPYGWRGVMAAMSSGGVLFSLLGFRQVVLMMGDIDNPGKYIPIVLMTSLLFTGILYTCLQCSFIGSLRPQDMMNGWDKLTFPGDAGPFAALAVIAGIMWLSILLYADAFISPYSTGLVYTTTAGRMLASMSDMGNAPKILESQNKYEAPWLSLCVNFMLAATMFFLLRDWQAMSAFLVAALMISYALGPIVLICLRKKVPAHPRPFKVRGGVAVAFIGFYICTAGVYWSGYHSVLKVTMITFICLIAFLLKHIFSKTLPELDAKHSIWLICYLIGLVIFSIFGNYGGNKWIPLYWDLLFLMMFSLFIFSFSYFSMKLQGQVLP